MALSANRALTIRNIASESRQSFVVETGAKIYKGALCQVTTSGTVEPCDDNTTDRFAGVAVDEADTGDGAVRVELFNDVEIRVPANASVTVANIGDPMYAEDDETVSEVDTLGPQIGVMTAFEGSTDIWVKLNSATMALGQ